MQVSNAGKSPAAKATLNLELPTAPGFEVKQIQGAGWTCQSQDGLATCSRDAIPPGGAPDVTLEVVPPLQQVSFTIKGMVGSSTFDANLLNNSAQVNLNNSAPCAIACPASGGNEPSGSGDAGTGSGPPSPSGCQCQLGGRAPASTSGIGIGALLAACLGLRRGFRRRSGGAVRP